MNIIELQNRCYETAKAKGWHDHDQLDENGVPTVTQFLAWVALAHSELAEAEEETAHHYVVDGKPEGKLVELADVVIRLLDDAGACGWAYVNGYTRPLSVNVALGRLTEAVRKHGVNRDAMVSLYLACDCAFIEAREFGYEANLFKSVILEKMAYNDTRSYRHGGKLA